MIKESKNIVLRMTGRVFLVAALLCMGSASFAFAGSKEITVSAAMSLKNAFEDIGRLYESSTKTVCVFNFGASGDLIKQISGGAPVDVFASASKKDMDEADRQGLTIAGTRADFALNSVVLIVPVGAKTGLKSFEGLKALEIQKIAVGNPKSVPAGRYAEDVFTFYNILASLKDKFIYTENVRQVLDYVARNEVDAGVVYATDAVARLKEVKIAATAPESSHQPVVYPVALVKGTKNESDAKAFIALVLSDQGRAVLQKYGFQSNQ